MRHKVLISVPNTGWIHKHVAFALLNLGRDTRYETQIMLPTHVPCENNQHHIIKDFMDGDYDYWLSFDSDNPPTRNPLDLVELDKDILGCPTPVWHCTLNGERPFYWNAYDYDEELDAYREHPPGGGLQPVDAIGSGCMLIARRVFEDSEMRKAPFQRVLHADGRVYKGNDLSFSERARARGWQIWAHYGYPCRHFVEVELTEAIQGFAGAAHG